MADWQDKVRERYERERQVSLDTWISRAGMGFFILALGIPAVGLFFPLIADVFDWIGYRAQDIVYLVLPEPELTVGPTEP